MAAARLLRALLVAALALGGSRALAADPSGLWHIVHDKCAPQVAATGKPDPCVSVGHDDAVLKDLIGATQYLLIPLARISGIEDPAVLAADAPNFFADAWAAIGLVGEAAHSDLKRDDLSLAINAPMGRSQDQLHIHLDCVREDVRRDLHGLAGAIGGSFAALPTRVGGRKWRALRIDGAELGTANPFRLLAETGAAGDMGSHTLVLVGMNFDGAPGFILLDGHTDLLAGDPGNGEALQDHDCAVAGNP